MFGGPTHIIFNEALDVHEQHGLDKVVLVVLQNKTKRQANRSADKFTPDIFASEDAVANYCNEDHAEN